MPVVRIPPPYRGPTLGEGEIPVESGTVRSCLDQVEARYPGFLAQVLDPAGAPHGFVKLFVNGELLDPDALDKPLADADELEVLAAIAGG